MKKIEFGYSNEDLPLGSFEGIGLGQIENGKAYGPVTGKLLGVISIDDSEYLAAETTQAFENNEKYIGRIIVRPTCVDLFPDGSAMLFIDQQESSVSKKLEELLNRDMAKKKIESGEQISTICGGYRAPFAYECAIRNDIEDVATLATAIRHDVFETKKNRIKKCRSSFSEIQRQLEEPEKQYQR